ncbi:MAG TPA: hypothetical protein PKW29_07970 [Clostridia bacterium]|nr:hypothetical protein [Clostridia bacterium]
MESLKPRDKKEERVTLALMLLLMLFGYVLIHDLLGGTLLAHSAWDSYTLQSLSWLEGRLDLGRNYDYLELAIYGGKYFVSFPPFPSAALLPFALVFGEHTPNNLLVALCAMASAALVYRFALRARFSPQHGALLALFLTWGGNLMWMSTNGGVWFMAQSLNFLLLLLALLFALKNRRVPAYLMVAFAVGCRPFSVFAFLPLFVYFYDRDRGEGRGFFRTALMQWKAWLPVAAVALAYMWYNWARFGNPLEFGHNHLPEFTEAQNGQFHLSYLAENLFNIWFRPVSLKLNLALDYPVFNGFLFYVANPFFLLLFAAAVRNLIRRSFSPARAALLAAMLFNMLALCIHKTFGGWQFGARYTVDMLPLALAYYLLSPRPGAGEPRLRAWEKAAAYFGILFNVYGALAMNFLYA